MSSNIYTSKSPHLDLHGETTATLNYIVKDYINDNYIMGNRFIAIIHGFHSTILKEEVHKILKKDKRVLNFYIDFKNIGQTIVELDIK